MYAGRVEVHVERRKIIVEGNGSLNPFENPINVLEEHELKKLVELSSGGVMEWKVEDPRRNLKPT